MRKSGIDKILYSKYDGNMGKVPEPETARDLALIEDYLAKDGENWAYTISQLGMKYARVQEGVYYPLTATRIHQILNKYGIEKSRVPEKK